MPQSASLCIRCGHSWAAATISSTSPTPQRSNELSSSAEANMIYRVIDETRDDLFRLDTEITRIVSMLDKLKWAREHLCRQLRNNQVVVSTLRHVPPEIWTEIFLYDPSRCPFMEF